MWALAVVFGCFSGHWIHELSHYIVGILGDSKPELEWFDYFPILPTGVSHQKINQINHTTIRISGLSPLIWAPAGFVGIIFFILNMRPVRLMMAISIVYPALTLSEGDKIAFSNPQKFREIQENDRYKNNNYWWSILMKKVGRK
jgi:hypothetical protein